MDNLFEYVKQQLLCEKEIIQNVYDLLQLLNSEFARELLDKQQGDFIITYYFSRQSRIKKFNKVSDELINQIYKYRNYNYMMQNQFDKIMQAITMSKTLQNEEQSYQFSDILDIGTMFKLLELDWIKRHNMTKMLSQPQTNKKIEQINLKEINQISNNQNYLLTDKDSSLQLYSNLNDLTNTKNKNINEDLTKLQKDSFIIEIGPQKFINQGEEEIKDSQQNNLDFNCEEVDKIISKNQQKCLEFFKSIKETWNFEDLKQGYFEDIQEKCIFHHTLSEEQIKILNKYEQSITKCRNKIKGNQKVQSRKLQSQNYESQGENEQQDEKLNGNKQIKLEGQDNNSQKQQNASDQKIKKKRGGFRKRRNQVNLDQSQQDAQQSIKNENYQVQSQNQNLKESSKDIHNQNEQLNQAICSEQVETTDSNEVSQQSQLNQDKMQIEESYFQNHNNNTEIKSSEQQQNRLVQEFNKIEQEQFEQNENNLLNHKVDSSKIKQLKVEENNFQLQSPLQIQFQDKFSNFQPYSFINSPFPQQFNCKIEQFQLEQLNYQNIQMNNSEQEQQKNEKLSYVQNDYNTTIIDEVKARELIDNNLFENIQLNFENNNFENVQKNVSNQLNYEDEYVKQQLEQNKITHVDDNQNINDQNFQISQELFKIKEESQLINETQVLLNNTSNQNQIKNKDENKQEYMDLQSNLNENKEFRYQDLIIEEEESQILEKLIQTGKLNKSHTQVNDEKVILDKNKSKEKDISDISNQAENASSPKDSPIKLRMVDIFELKSQSNNNISNQNTSTEKQSELISQKVKSPNKIQKMNKEKRKKKIGKTFKELTLQELEIIKKSSLKDASNLAKQLGMSYQTMRKVIAKVQNGNNK
ncbi:hypothetical protein TTHERM_00765140 (macronuclear) [Tetrahymena thermophila SB210]|uniref:Uncharacterized protein n=1 Tax=Tetrahymena thermophila (strain SB210) TaxID=312017 RepID=I7MML3_TETTS|nr:hypothetical protein TTHERM_00765140 [Tetrahymena thermophila SB210]EAS05129.4 hypothetical protein TTHERM_00765140 [Tetrahymena thermophila SB210]|eukprot:XP_001025374.4 hypothetical protein TTHERM_00765140 [Tetrahymena thermophila SB210]